MKKHKTATTEPDAEQPTARAEAVIHHPAPAAPIGEILDDAQASRYLISNPRQLRLWRNQFGLPFVRVTKRTLRYRKTDLDNWLARRRVAISA